MLLTGAQMLFVGLWCTGIGSVADWARSQCRTIYRGYWYAGVPWHYQARTVPVFLASSFAFIAPIQGSIASFGVSATLGGLMAAGVVYVAISQVVRVKGTAWLHRLLPPVVVGPVIMVIGLALAPVAVSMATGETSDNIGYGQAIFLFPWPVCW